MHCQRLSVFVILVSAGLLGCPGDPPVTPDAGAIDAAPASDATTPDAGGLCPGQLLFTGGYEDWDSTLGMFDGIEFTDVTHRQDPSNTAQTAPNGRVTMCVPRNQVASFDFQQPDYLDLRYTMSPVAQLMGPFEIRGLTPARALELFAVELGLTRDDQAAQVLVAVRRYPEDEPAYGARVSLGNGNAGAYTNDGTGRYAPGDQLIIDSIILFANVDVGAGTTTVSVAAPPGYVCLGNDTIELAPGALAATTFACVVP